LDLYNILVKATYIIHFAQYMAKISRNYGYINQSWKFRSNLRA